MAGTGDSKYRLQTLRRLQQVYIMRRLGLSIVLSCLVIFVFHAWRQSHRPASPPNNLVNPYAEEIRTLKSTIQSLTGQMPKKRGRVPYDPRLGAIAIPKEEVEVDAELFDRMIVFDDYVPNSVVACSGRNATERVCRIKNFCFDPTRNLFFILKNGASIVQYGKQTNETRLVDGTSIDGHNRFYLDYVEADPSILLRRPVHWVDRVTYIMARFHRLNIMHTLHDDFLGLYHIAKLYGPANREDPTAPFSLDTNIFFSDWYRHENYDYLFRMISQNPLQYRSEWRRSTAHPVCFAQAIVGNSKHSTWYNYGFLEPQAPIRGKQVDGLHVRDAARYMLRRLGIASWNIEGIKRVHRELMIGIGERAAEMTGSTSNNNKVFFSRPIDEAHYITIFVRTRDRLLLNLQQLEQTLSDTYGLPARQVRMEDQTLTEQIMTLRTTMVAVGLHGSALILGMFLPPGAVLVELFPFAVPPENYTPYRTMAELPGMRLVYRAWQNTHREHNFPHPDRQQELGGLSHLELEERQRIETLDTVPPHLCCRDSTWLYRIYQDTIVHIPELIAVIDSGIAEAGEKIAQRDRDFYVLTPAAPDVVECEVFPRLPLGSRAAAEAADNPLDMTVRWSLPWNGVKAVKFGLWVHQHYAEFFTNDSATHIVLEECSPGTTYDLWVRGYAPNGEPGLYSEKFQCSCAIGATAVKVEKSVQKY